jgi:hypothetical protein
MDNNKLKIAVLDFGMAFAFDEEKSPSEISQAILKGNAKYIHAPGVENDLYFPYRSDTLFAAFERGMKKVLASLGEESTKKTILKDVIEHYDSE